jgi:internalin A
MKKKFGMIKIVSKGLGVITLFTVCGNAYCTPSISMINGIHQIASIASKTPVNIDNEGLEQEIRKTINKPNGVLYETDLENVTDINLGEQSAVKNIKGITLLKNLKEVTLESQSTSDLKEIAKLPRLKKVSINCGCIKDISPLKNIEELYMDLEVIEDEDSIKQLKNLKKIFIRNYHYGQYANDTATNIISKLKGMKHLQQLVVSDDIVNNLNDIKDIKSLRNLDLQILNKVDNKYILPLKELKNLNALRIYSNHGGITDIGVLKNLKNLQFLSIDNQNISNIDSLSGLNNLKFLSLNNNKITNVKALSKLSNLKWVDLKSNRIKDISPLSSVIKKNAKVVYKDTEQANFSWWDIVFDKELHGNI